MLGDIYNAILYRPLFNILVFFYNVGWSNIAVAIVLLTAFIKLLLWPFFMQSIRAQKSMQTLQPKIEELKAKYKDDKQKLGPALMELYKTEKANPLSSCLPLLLQLPFLIAVYQVFRVGLANKGMDLLYTFVANPGNINVWAFGIDFSKGNWVMAVLAGAAQFWQTKMMLKKKPMATNGSLPAGSAEMINKQMMYMMPAITVFIGFSLPSGLTFYWLIMTLFGVFQQWLVLRKDIEK